MGIFVRTKVCVHKDSKLVVLTQHLAL